MHVLFISCRAIDIIFSPHLPLSIVAPIVPFHLFNPVVVYASLAHTQKNCLSVNHIDSLEAELRFCLNKLTYITF